MGAKQSRYAIATAAVMFGLAAASPVQAVPGFAQVGPGAGDIGNNCVNNPEASVQQRLDACTQAVQSTAWHATAWPYYYRAHVYFELKKDDLALADLDSAIKIARTHDPVLPKVYHLRCDMRAEKDRDLKGALSDCTRSLELKPNEESALFSRALVEYELSDYAATVADCNAALALQSDDTGAQDLLKQAKAKSPEAVK